MKKYTVCFSCVKTVYADNVDEATKNGYEELINSPPCSLDMEIDWILDNNDNVFVEKNNNEETWLAHYTTELNNIPPTCCNKCIGGSYSNECDCSDFEGV